MGSILVSHGVFTPREKDETIDAHIERHNQAVETDLMKAFKKAQAKRMRALKIGH